MKHKNAWNRYLNLKYDYNNHQKPVRVYYMNKEELKQYLSKYKETNKHQLKY